MRSDLIKKEKIRKTRTIRVRKVLRGTSSKPRLCVVKSNKHIHAQLIDDETGKTLGMAATFAKEIRGTEFAKKNKASAAKLGEQIAAIAKGHNVSEVIFDRGPFKYHGILAALADSARAAGLQF
jgi:large subunit ribosomal protein L18